jgi:Domain of unknown function (DUF4166)
MVFRSAGYFLQVLHRRVSLPVWAVPGQMSITHADLGDGSFRFTLEVAHPRLGTLIRQTCVFRDANS